MGRNFRNKFDVQGVFHVQYRIQNTEYSILLKGTERKGESRVNLSIVDGGFTHSQLVCMRRDYH